MKTFTSKLFLIFCLLLGFTATYAQNLEWVKTYSKNYYENISINAIVVDSLGNSYTTGYFSDTIDFDGGSNTHFLFPDTALLVKHCFIKKDDPNGNLIWVKSTGKATTYHHTIGEGISLSPNGDVVVLGQFNGRVDFNPGPDSFYLESSNQNLYILKLDSLGNFKWAKQIQATIPNYLNPTVPSYTNKSIRIDQHNNIYITGLFKDSADLDPGTNTYHVTTNSSYANFITKLDPLGNFVWGHKLGELGSTQLPTLSYNQHDAIYIAGHFTDSIAIGGTTTIQSIGNFDFFYMKMDTSGQAIWLNHLKPIAPSNNSFLTGSIATDSNGELLIAGESKGNFDFDPNPGTYPIDTTENLFFLKINSNGQLVWLKQTPSALSTSFSHNITTDQQGNFYYYTLMNGTVDIDPGPLTQSISDTTIPYLDCIVTKFTSNGALTWARQLQHASWGGHTINDIAILGSSIYIAGHCHGAVDFNPAPQQHVINLNAQGAFILKLKSYNHFISGNIYHDINLNCQRDSLETDLHSIVVKAIGNQIYWGLTDSLGNYSIPVDIGNYNIYPNPNNQYWQSCQPSFNATVNNAILIDTVDIGLQETINCPFMQVDISAPLLRQTANGSNYTVSYCNTGTDTAWAAFVRVDLDSYLNFLNSTIPFSSQNDNSYSFMLGDVPPNTCGNFQIQVIVDTSAIIGQTHCTEAHIYPDTICNVTWNDYILDIDASCPNNDTVYFQIQNIGTASMGSKQYYVFEDDVIFYIGNTGGITIGNSHIVPIAANPGKTYRLEIAQAPTYPALLGDSIASAAIEGCHPYPDGSFETGYITQFYNGFRAPFMALDCQQNVAAYDPNDKSAQPAGYAAAHFIEQHTTLDYKIRFQNTGNDTAFQVILVDTLSAFLDPSSIEITAGSHPFTWNLSGQGVLTFTFDNILLPDSSTNEPASHGFVKFKIHQQPNNPIGTVINNFADIYFDLNPPIRTNTTLHTIGENFVTINVSVDQIFDKAIDVLVYPNPFSESTTIEIQGKEYESLELTVYDITGRSVQQLNTTFQQQIQLNRGNLTPGIYVYQLKGNQKIINTGKLIVR